MEWKALVMHQTKQKEKHERYAKAWDLHLLHFSQEDL